MDNDLDSEMVGPNLGMTSLVIGIVGLFLFFLPILGIPLSLFGLAFGVSGLLVSIFTKGVSLRWSVGGVGVCILGLAVNLMIAAS
jgi:hypothetical protein